VVALAAATILTGGAALAIAGAVAGTGAAVGAGTVATVVAGGAVAGAGLNLIQQGTHIKDGRIDPATGQKKTDFNYGEIVQSGVVGAVTAPVAAVALGAAPVLVGGAAVTQVGTGAVNAYNNFTGNNFLTNNNPEHTKNNWSGAFDVGTSLMAAAPFATKGGRSAMFGAEARARTAQTASNVWKGAGDLAGKAWNGSGNLASRAWNGAGELAGKAWTGGGELASRALSGASNWGSKVLTGAGNLGIRAINSTKNGVFDVADALSPQHATPEGFIVGGNRPKDIPLIKNEPMRMQSNNPEGPQIPGTQGKSPGQQSSPKGKAANPGEVKTPKPSELSPKEIARYNKQVDKVIEKANTGKVREHPDYHGRLGREKELDVLSNPDAVYVSEGKAGNFIYRKGNDIVVTKGGSENGQLLTSYGPSGPRGESGAAALKGGNPTDPGAPITHEMITNGEIPTPKGKTLAPAEIIRGKLEESGEP
jgi:hypothetical protein